MVASPGAPPRDVEVLGRLLVLHAHLDAGEADQLVAMLIRGLEDVPGVHGVRFAAGDAETPGGELGIPIGAPTRARGAVVLHLEDPVAFAPYEPYVRNLVGALAMRLEAEEQRVELSAAHDRLDRLAGRCAAELEAATRELASLSYAVSHELWAPLRAIDGFAALLEERDGVRMDGDARAHLARIRRASGRMGKLLDDLLRLLSVARAPLHRDDVDLAELARDVVARMRRRDPSRDVTFEAPERLVVRGDAQLLDLALDTLLDNAWKFTARRAHAHVQLGAVGSGDATAYFVRDDGVGFDAERARHTFEPFWRAHRDGDYAGGGVGLAIAKRAIERHGGRIWAESTPGAGATFWFTVPATS